MAEYKVMGINLAKRKFHSVGFYLGHESEFQEKLPREEFFLGSFFPMLTKKQTPRKKI